MNEIILKKMLVTKSSTVAYRLAQPERSIDMNSAIGKTVSINFTGKIYCSWCGQTTKKSFAQGYCYNCFVNCPETQPCVLSPEKCTAQWGVSRDMAWATEHHLQAHIVYLSYTSNYKVGVTRKTQLPTRWIDQGALAAIAILELPNRHVAGVVETLMKKFFSDRTQWRNMLSTRIIPDDFWEQYEYFIQQLPAEFKQYLIVKPEISTFVYPIDSEICEYKSLSLDKTPNISGVLSGIKGQYLIFKGGRVLNVRKHGGYQVFVNIT